MNDITKKQDIQIDAMLVEAAREFAFRVVQLHMDTKRSELLLGGFKEYLRRRFPLAAPCSHTRDRSASSPSSFRIPRVMSGDGSWEE